MARTVLKLDPRKFKDLPETFSAAQLARTLGISQSIISAWRRASPAIQKRFSWCEKRPMISKFHLMIFLTRTGRLKGTKRA